MNNKILYTLILSLFVSIMAFADGTPVTVIKGKYTSTKQPQRLKKFTVAKGDIVEINLTTLHKKRGMHIWIKQHPGSMIVLDFEELQTSKKQFVAPVDAIYEIYFGGKKLDFEIDVTKYTTKPNGPDRGEPVYVRIPDTLHASGYVTIPVGESYTLEPYKEKVILKTSMQSEQICNRNFITGVDLLELDIPGTVKDEYREQKLLRYTVTLTCGEIGMQKALMGVVDAGIDAFVKIPGPKSKNKGKMEKTKSKNQYKFVDNVDEASNKMETVTELVGIAQEGADTLAPGSSTAKVLETTAFVLDGGVKEIVMEKAMDAAGVPKNVQAVVGAVESFPSVSDMTKNAVHKIVPSIKGSARMIIQGEIDETENIAEIPLKEFWIQSAMNFAKDDGGYWDVPAKPSSGKNGLNIQCWGIDDGVDRKFKMVPSQKHPGFYEIKSAMNGFTLDNSGGEKNCRNNGNNLQLWETNGGNGQLFQFAHLGNGKFKIYNTGGHVVCLEGRKNGNNTNINIWEDQKGAWNEWFLIDPVTRQAFVPTKTTPKSISKKYTISDDKNGLVNREIKVNSKTPVSKAYLRITRNGAEAKAKLLVEAHYEITDYTDVIKYKRTTNKQMTQDFWTAYKVNYDYGIMFKDQIQEGWQQISENEYYGRRPNTEVVSKDNIMQKVRLDKYNYLTKQKTN